MADEKARFVSVDELPDDPLSMPPPYWRCSGAIFHILAALRALSIYLSDLIPLHARTERKLDKYYAKYPDGTKENDEFLAAFSDICDELWRLEHRIRLESERAILMSAINAEDVVNQFCVFNLHRDIAESIEKLSLPEKLLVASAALGKPGVKGTSVYEGTRKLAGWRNAFAHGHCVDRPVKSLRHNHLISPDEYPGVPGAAHDAMEFVGYYLAISRYLESISLNTRTGQPSAEDKELDLLLFDISRYRFKGDQIVYSVTCTSKARKKKRRSERSQRAQHGPNGAGGTRAGGRP
jgi:hypothetical protein